MMKNFLIIVGFCFGIFNATQAQIKKSFYASTKQPVTVTATSTNIKIKATVQQVFQWDNENFGKADNIQFKDYNSDGYKDVLVSASDQTVNSYCRIFLYILNKKKFQEAKLTPSSKKLIAGGVLCNVSILDNKKGIYCTCRFSASAYSYDKLKFNNQNQLYLSSKMVSSLLPWKFKNEWNISGLIEKYNEKGEKINSKLVNDAGHNVLARVYTKELQLYNSPNDDDKAAIALKYNDSLTLLDEKDGKWIKIGFETDAESKKTKWIKASDVNIYDSKFMAQNYQNYPSEKISFSGSFLLPDSLYESRVTNNGKHEVDLNNSDIYQLFLPIRKGDTVLNKLYNMGERKYFILKPGKSTMLDDNYVSYNKTTHQYELAHSGKDALFIPRSISGEYKMIFVLINPYLSNPVIFSRPDTIHIPKDNKLVLSVKDSILLLGKKINNIRGNNENQYKLKNWNQGLERNILAFAHAHPEFIQKVYLKWVENGNQMVIKADPLPLKKHLYFLTRIKPRQQLIR